jgi:hypothetical protein
MMDARFSLAVALLPVFATQICAASELKIPAARYPILPESAVEVTAFVPTGWSLESKSEGDLNTDGIDDVVFVLREDNPANVVENPDGLGSERLNTNPRILGVAFRGNDGTNYRLPLSNRTLIPRHKDPVLDDPFASPGGLELARGSFSLTLYFFASAGGWEMGPTKLTFCFQNDRFELIGLDRSWIHRGTGETTDLSINLSTGRISTTLGNIAEDDPREVQRTSLSSKKRYAIDEITDAFRFDPRNP